MRELQISIGDYIVYVPKLDWYDKAKITARVVNFREIDLNSKGIKSVICKVQYGYTEVYSEEIKRLATESEIAYAILMGVV